VLPTQLQPEHRAVVERHIRSCTVCAHQQMNLTRITERVRNARPRVPVPMEAKTLARQLALRSLAMNRLRRSQVHTARVRTVSRTRWYRSRVFWVAAVAGMATALCVAAIALILL